MQADFLDAHERHWKDAESLFSANRFANADHLYGMAAECGLKRLMMRFGMGTAPLTGSPIKQDDRVHANIVWDRFESYRSGKVEGASYGLPMQNPFSDWRAEQRYAHQSNFDQQLARAHQDGAIVVRELIRKAQYEGLLL